MKILVTGAGGYIGSYLSTRFVADDYDVYILTRRLPTFTIDGVKRLILADVTNKQQLDQRLPKMIDAVLHLATANNVWCGRDPKQTMVNNWEGTQNIINWCIKKGVRRFVYFSTLQVYGKELRGVISEKSPVQIEDEYALSHFVGESVANLYSKVPKLDINILRLVNVMGCPIDKTVDRWTLVPNCFCKGILKTKGVHLQSSGLQNRDFVTLDQVYRSTKKILKKNNKNRKIYNISSGQTYSIIDMARFVADQTEKKYGSRIKVSTGLDLPKKANKFIVTSDLNKPVKRFHQTRLIKQEIEKILDLVGDSND
ncbi:MAG: hypothetical protein ACD_19C00085G0002 [uncultured bacterium]|nr:MAG: hypothetical protein ACD_19C00085G0002 [uncultured bacterium]